MYIVLVTFVSSFLWRVRGGLRFGDKKLPFNKIWYAIFFSIIICLAEGFSFNLALTAFIAAYAGYQLYGWGVYVSRIYNGKEVDPNVDKECELIDDLLLPLHISIKGNVVYLSEYPKIFGFIGTCLTGFILTFLMGLASQSVGFMFWGLGMGPCYWLGSKLENYYALGKEGWNWGEYVFGFYLGLGYYIYYLS